ncbi:zf-HC2 domain-containing protein [Streptomyces kebangsaanensis]|uniref:Zf-HC2 domain-containing protein n=1 Tax=Streptomyces kebangsaanensis TaxID=864058 RepID=A0ABW6KYW0_9ACTN
MKRHSPTAGEAWHLSAEELRAYARGGPAAPRLRAAESHLDGCPECRRSLTDVFPRTRLDTIWERVDVAIDEPRRGLLERGLLRLRVAEHDARLIAATPALRRTWVAGAVVVLLLAVLAARLLTAVAAPLTLLAVAPVLPAVGMALSWGPRFDPAHEIALTTPTSGFRIAMVRTTAVLAVSTVLGGAASLALPRLGLAALGWLLPSLALTLVTLVLASRFDPLRAAAGSGAAWLLALAVTTDTETGEAWLLSAPGQATAAVGLVAAAVLLAVRRSSFEHIPFRSPSTIR